MSRFTWTPAVAGAFALKQQLDEVQAAINSLDEEGPTVTAPHTHEADDITDLASVALSTFAPATGDLNLNSNNITNVATPFDPTDAVNKAYADSLATGLSVRQAVIAATTANITLSGEQTIDDVAVVAGDRVLVKNQSTASQNGIYIVASGAWSRSSDADADADVTSGMFTLVTSGTTNQARGYVLITPNPITLGTTSLTFAQFSGGGGSSLTVLDESVALAGAASELDFVGEGVTVTGTGAKKTINVPGPASAGGITYQQDTDPGATGAGTTWLKTNDGTFWRRNAANSAWLPVRPDTDGTDIRWFGAIGNGTASDSAAIQAAHDYAFTNTRWPVIFPKPSVAWVITTPISYRSGAWFKGSGIDGGQSEIRMQSTDMTADAFRTNRSIYSAAALASKTRFEDMRILDYRATYYSTGQPYTDTGNVRTGIGINTTYETNGTYIKNCQVQLFYKNVLVGSTDSGTDGDCIEVDQLWCPHALKYGLHILRPSNATIIRGIKGDTVGDTNPTVQPQMPSMEALVCIEGAANLSNPISIDGVKHECSNSTTDTIQVIGNAVASIKNVCMRSHGGRDVVRFTTGDGTGTTLENIAAGSIANGYNFNAAVNLVNVVSEGFVIPLAAGGVVPFLAFGGVREKIRSFSGGPQNVSSQDGIVTLTGTSSYTVNLPTAAKARGKTITFIKTGASGTVTLDPSGAELINGASTLALATQFKSVPVFSDGTQWWAGV